jgi:CDP-glycerol glycerophosphotransferase (TagB/SpsB family)
MKRIAEHYSDEIQFSFKPHPLLKDKLHQHDDWGIEKTDGFFEFWNASANTQLNLADYCDLFLTSDAIIHDSGSFLAEYLYVDKPAMYMVADENLTQKFSPFGKLAFEVCSHGSSIEDIRLFIEKDVLQELDEMKCKRSEFIHRQLIKDGSIPSDNIFSHLLQVLKR